MEWREWEWVEWGVKKCRVRIGAPYIRDDKIDEDIVTTSGSDETMARLIDLRDGRHSDSLDVSGVRLQSLVSADNLDDDTK